MKSPFRLLTLPVVISALSLQLGGCGQSNNNLVDPVADLTNTITSCDKKDICTTGQFIDEPVVGLNYECNKVKGLTDSDGTFACPNNSVATFYLQAEKGKYRITLGSYLVRAIGDITGKPLKTILQITPKDLVKSVADTDVIGTNPDGVQVINIMRLLQALDSDGSFNEQVLNRIVITDDMKKQIDVLGGDVGLTSFTANDVFQNTLKPFLDKLSISLPAPALAVERFNKSLPVLQSGVYEVSPFTIPKTDSITGDILYTGMLGEKTGSDTRAFEALFFLIDREGKSIGLGLEWKGLLTKAELDNTLLQKLLVQQTPIGLKFASEDIGFNVGGSIKSDPISKKSKFTLDAEDGGQVIINQGQMLKGNISGNSFFYRNVYGLADAEIVNDTSIGKWSRLDATDTHTEILSGSVNMNKTRTVTPFLDGSVWKTNENVAVGEKAIFPLHLKLMLRDKDVDNTSCSTAGCLVGTMGITILANGNIISDRNNDCTPINPVTLMDDYSGIPEAAPSATAIQEHRLGMISAILADDTGAPIKSISPIIMVGDWVNELSDASDPWKKFFGIYLGAQSVSGGPKVEINIANVISNNTVTIQNQSDETTSGVAATWTNYVGILKAFSVKPEADQKQLANRSQGQISEIETQACYKPIAKI